jgi:DNA-binding NarL/FixJ family response regulator
MNQIQLGIVEDEPLVMDTLEAFMSKQPDIKVALTASSIEVFLKGLKTAVPIDMVLLDIGLPGMSGLEGIRYIKEERPDIDILILTASDDSEKVFKALCSGAVSYISKRTNLQTIKDAVLTVNGGGAYMSPAIARRIVEYFAPKKSDRDEPLTPRQLQIAQGLIDGLSYKMVADRLNISTETVRDHIKKIYKKLEINSKAELIKKKLDDEF